MIVSTHSRGRRGRHRAPWAAALALLAVPALAQDERRLQNGALLAHPIVGPTVISQPGSYVVLRSFSSSGTGAAIRIVASNVSLDLNGHTLTGPGGKQGTGVAVVSTGGVRIHNGILSRFGTGIEVSDATNVRVEGVQIRGEDLGGPPPGEIGILLRNSRAVVLERNQISRVFLGIFVRGGGAGANRIAENTIAGGQNGQLGICYNPDGSSSTDGPTGDLVYNNLVSRFQVGIQTSAGTSGNIFRENDLAYVAQAIHEVTPGTNLFVDNSEIQITL